VALIFTPPKVFVGCGESLQPNRQEVRRFGHFEDRRSVGLAGTAFLPVDPSSSPRLALDGPLVFIDRAVLLPFIHDRGGGCVGERGQ
jgi:hypothetical protein